MLFRSVYDEFKNDRHDPAKHPYLVRMWRFQFNRGDFHRTAATNKTFVAFQVNSKKQFCFGKHKEPLTLEALQQEYDKRGLTPSPALRKEVQSYGLHQRSNRKVRGR